MTKITEHDIEQLMTCAALTAGGNTSITLTHDNSLNASGKVVVCASFRGFGIGSFPFIETLYFANFAKLTQYVNERIFNRAPSQAEEYREFHFTINPDESKSIADWLLEEADLANKIVLHERDMMILRMVAPHCKAPA